MAWLAFRGWPELEVWNSLHPALALAKALERNDALTPIFMALMSHVLTRGRVAEALEWANEALDAARTTGDSDLLVSAHTFACTCHFWAGRLNEALEHHDRVWSLYDDEKHRHLTTLLNHDPKTVTGTYAPVCLWMLGYPDRAVALNEVTDAHARIQGHPFDLAFALSVGSDLFHCRHEPGTLHHCAEEIERLGREHSLPFLWGYFAPIRSGLALIDEEKPAEGIAALRSALHAWEASGGRQYSPYLKAVVAQGLAQSGDLEGALELVDQQLAQMDRPGWEERLYQAEVLRLKGWMLSLKGDLEGAERNFLASLDWAREQQARSWQLRTSTSLARLWQAQGRCAEAHELLAPVYEWFTEGFDTKDLQEAKALLDDLVAS
jgi:predicted ATPase